MTHYIDTRLQSILSQAVPELAPIASILPVSAPGGTHANIRRITLSSGERLIVKRHLFAQLAREQGYDVLDAEQRIASLLTAANCNVPRVLGTHGPEDLIFQEDVGKQTLDDLAQTEGPVTRVRLAERALKQFCRLQRVLARAPLQDDIAPGTDVKTVQSEFAALAAIISPETLTVLPADHRAEASARIRELIQKLSEAKTFIGPTDYNARNIVVNALGEPYFLECAKVGYDWPERRLVQYLTSLGSGRPGSRPRSLLDRDLVSRYAASPDCLDPEGAAERLDAHHLIFHVLLAHRYPEAWRIPRTVRAALITPLSDDDKIGKLRGMFRGYISAETSSRDAGRPLNT